MKVHLIAALTFFLSSAAINSASADLIFDFTLVGDSASPGTVTGNIRGLVDNASGQTATQLFITSSTINLVLIFPFSAAPGGTFDVSGGQIVDVELAVFTLGNQFVLFGDNGANKADDSVQVIENLGGVTFSEVSSVPEPSTWAMMILGFFGVGAMTYRRRKSAMLAA
jgi:hypothetical protein